MTWTSAQASHILVKNINTATNLKSIINSLDEFRNLAMEYSIYHTYRQGGYFGYFLPGEMVPEIDNIVTSGEPHTLLGPIKSCFGYHLLYIHSKN